jgi:SpoVK/Ycf46/Vps4 family AAA+-type ATPase
MNDVKDFTLIIRSRFPIVVVETQEEPRLLELLERVARLEGQGLFVWSAADGLRRRDNPLAHAPGSYPRSSAQDHTFGRGPLPDTRDIAGALKHIYATSYNGIYALLDVHPYLREPVILRLIKSTALEYGKTARTVVLVGHKIELPEDLRRLCARFDMALPDARAIRELIKEEAKRLVPEAASGKLKGQQEAFDLISQYLAGTCEEDARRLVGQCLSDDGALTMEDVGRVLKYKKEKFGENSVVELELETTRLSDVAGLDNLKRWLTRRRAAFLGDAASMGLDAPKGILLLGVQGAGKSLAAKAVAGTWGVPLLRLDFATLYNKWLGETERNLREALKFADAMAPCVLWMDEIEKGVATGTAEGGGESRRLLGTILTWMAERKSKVFMVATANDIEALPPELIRKGRFDEIFFVDLPDTATRGKIFEIHLARRKLDLASFDLAALTAATAGFSGAEIEQAIVSALYEAHALQQPLATGHVQTEVSRTRPLSVVMADKISQLRAWAAERTVPAG